MMKPIIGVGLALTFACGGVDVSDMSEPGNVQETVTEAAADAEATDADSDIIHHFTINDEEITFHWLGHADPSGSDFTIGIAESIRTVDHVRTLQAEYGAVTSLEIFNAFAPEGLTAHPALVAAHELEASAMGRSGDELAVQAIDGHQLAIDKAIPANCQTLILPDISPGTWTQIQTTNVGLDGQFVYTCAGSPKKSGIIATKDTFFGCSTFSVDKQLSVGLCNDSASPNSTEFYTRKADSVGSSVTTRTSVAANSAGRFMILPSVLGLARSLAVIGRNVVNDPNNHQQRTGVGVF
jgi:hypothetical protein